MTFPARRAFSRDRRRGLTDIAVYEFLEEELHEKVKVRTKLSWVALETGLREQHISQALKHLVMWGYLRDHRKNPRDPRELTIVRDWPPAQKAA